MRTVSVILSVSLLILLASMILCGLWIANHPESDPAKAAESRRFHQNLGFLTVAVGAVLSILVLAGKAGS